MRINGASANSATSMRRKANRKSAASDGAFGRHVSANAAASSPNTSVRATLAAAPINPLLGLQEVADATGAPAREVRRGHDLLDQLDRIRHGLLLGTISRQHLLNLMNIINKKKELVEDKRLSSILSEIELRAAVELAKFEQA